MREGGGREEGGRKGGREGGREREERERRETEEREREEREREGGRERGRGENNSTNLLGKPEQIDLGFLSLKLQTGLTIVNGLMCFRISNLE
jgi:hypothetical protein